MLLKANRGLSKLIFSNLKLKINLIICARRIDKTELEAGGFEKILKQASYSINLLKSKK